MISSQDIDQFAYEVALMWSEKVGDLSEDQFDRLWNKLEDLFEEYSEPE